MNYNKLYELKTDKQQMIFNNGGVQMNNCKVLIDNQQIQFDTKVLCPFCLNDNTFDKFKKDRAWYICPKCKNLLTVKTCLSIIKMDVEQYAKWVFLYRLSGFFKKVDFEQWTNKMYEMGISFKFWKEYKRLKGEESYEYE